MSEIKEGSTHKTHSSLAKNVRTQRRSNTQTNTDVCDDDEREREREERRERDKKESHKKNHNTIAVSLSESALFANITVLTGFGLALELMGLPCRLPSPPLPPPPNTSWELEFFNSSSML